MNRTGLVLFSKFVYSIFVKVIQLQGSCVSELFAMQNIVSENDNPIVSYMSLHCIYNSCYQEHTYSLKVF